MARYPATKRRTAKKRANILKHQCRMEWIHYRGWHGRWCHMALRAPIDAKINAVIRETAAEWERSGLISDFQIVEYR